MKLGIRKRHDLAAALLERGNVHRRKIASRRFLKIGTEDFEQPAGKDD